MAQLKTKDYGFKPETGEAFYVYCYKDRLFTGVAKCHPDDEDFSSETVGLMIAETRAFVKYLKVRRRDLEVRYQTLVSAYTHCSTSKDFNPKDSSAIKMRQLIQDAGLELEECSLAIKRVPNHLKENLDSRELMYQKIRANRKGENTCQKSSKRNFFKKLEAALESPISTEETYQRMAEPIVADSATTATPKSGLAFHARQKSNQK